MQYVVYTPACLSIGLFLSRAAAVALVGPLRAAGDAAGVCRQRQPEEMGAWGVAGDDVTAMVRMEVQAAGKGADSARVEPQRRQG